MTTASILPQALAYGPLMLSGLALGGSLAAWERIRLLQLALRVHTATVDAHENRLDLVEAATQEIDGKVRRWGEDLDKATSTAEAMVRAALAGAEPDALQDDDGMTLSEFAEREGFVVPPHLHRPLPTRAPLQAGAFVSADERAERRRRDYNAQQKARRAAMEAEDKGLAKAEAEQAAKWEGR